MPYPLISVVHRELEEVVKSVITTIIIDLVHVLGEIVLAKVPSTKRVRVGTTLTVLVVY